MSTLLMGKPTNALRGTIVPSVRRRSVPAAPISVVLTPAPEVTAKRFAGTVEIDSAQLESVPASQMPLNTARCR